MADYLDALIIGATFIYICYLIGAEMRRDNEARKESEEWNRRNP